LADYGLAPVNANPNLTVALPTVGNSRWLAPEIINQPPDVTEPVVESLAADIFALGMVGIEVFTGRPPFDGRSDAGVACLISKGSRPERPHDAEGVGLTIPVWELLERCWDQDPAKRPTIQEVVRSCEALLGGNQPTQRTLADQSHVEPVPDAESSLTIPTPPLGGTGGDQTRPGKRTLSSQYIPSSSIMCVTMCRFPKAKEMVEEVTLWMELSSELHPHPLYDSFTESPRLNIGSHPHRSEGPSSPLLLSRLAYHRVLGSRREGSALNHRSVATPHSYPHAIQDSICTDIS
jgi:hypothetical protein